MKKKLVLALCLAATLTACETPLRSAAATAEVAPRLPNTVLGHYWCFKFGAEVAEDDPWLLRSADNFDDCANRGGARFWRRGGKWGFQLGRFDWRADCEISKIDLFGPKVYRVHSYCRAKREMFVGDPLKGAKLFELWQSKTGLHWRELEEDVRCLKPDGAEESCESRKPAPPVPADEQAVKCLKPDGTEESCASRQSFFEPTKRYDAEGLEKLLPPPFGPADKTFLGGEPGGRIDQHIERWKALAASGDNVEIRGFCWSACTLVTAYIPKERLCFSKTAMLAFHLARFPNGEPSMEGSRRMFDAYPEDIRAWLRAKGGLEKMPLQGFWLMFPSELWQMGYRDCAWLGSIPGTYSHE